MNRLALICQNCGAVLPAPGAPCSACGTNQKDVDATEEEMADSLRARSVRPVPVPAKVGLVSSLRPERVVVPWWKQPPLLIGGLIGVLVVAGGAFVAMKKEPVEAAPASVAPEAPEQAASPSRQSAPAPAASAEVVPTEAAPSNAANAPQLAAAWSQAVASAKQWNKDAVLVSVKAGPIKGNGTLDVAGGASVELEFGLTAQDSLSNNPTVGEQRFVWSLDKEGTRGVPGKGSRSSRAASEPACPYDEALNKGVASGLANRMLVLRYEYSAEREKSVWVLQAADDPKVTRVFDAYSCAILAR